MSINDYWTAKIRATEAGGDEAAPEEVPATEVSEETAEVVVEETVTEEVVEEATEEVEVEEAVVADEAPEALPVVEEEEALVEEGDFESEKALATAKVPTSATNKQEIRNYLIYEHGIDPDDLQDMTKDDLLSLVTDLAE